MALDHEFGAKRLLVRIRDSGKIADFTLQGFAVETFDVTFDQSIERAFDINLEEAVMLAPYLVTDFTIRRDRRRNRDHAVAREQFTDIANPANVGVTVLLGKSQALG